LCYDSGTMDARRRLFSYLLINILVSAAVTGSIIFFYDRAQRADCVPTLPAGSFTPSSSDINVAIAGVIGTGTLADERVLIQNNGTEKLDLTGWYLEDNKGVIYTFPQTPQLTLFPGGTVQVHTKAGIDSLPDLYWGQAEPVWNSGELAALYDQQNIARAFYRIP
jgi:hypothetical protein